MEKLTEVFNALDVNHRGFITVEEFKSSFETFDGSTSRLSESLSSSGFHNLKEKEEKLDSIISLISNGDGRIFLNDFVNGMKDVISLEDVDSVLMMDNNDDEDFDSAFSLSHSQEHSQAISGLEFDADDDSVHCGDGLPPKVKLRPPKLNKPGIQRQGIRASWPKRHPLTTTTTTITTNLIKPQDQKEIIYNHRRTGSACSFASSLAGSRSAGDPILTYNDLDIQLNRMEEQLVAMANEKSKSEMQHTYLIEENRRLLEKVRLLEQRLHDATIQSQQTLENYREKMRQAQMEMENSHRENVNQLRAKLHALDKQIAELHIQAAGYRGEIEKCNWEKENLEIKLSDSSSQSNQIQEQMQQYRQKYKLEMNQLREERQLFENKAFKMEMELTNLRQGTNNFNNNNNSNNGTNSISEVQQRYREVQDLVRCLTTENKVLQKQVEDLQDELDATTINKNGSTINNKQEQSLAFEMDNHSRDELLTMLMREKETSYRLRNYIDKMVSTIIEKQPSLLEVD